MTAVVPIRLESPLPHLGRQPTKVGTLHFFGVLRRRLQAGKLDDRLELQYRYEHACATPEKALIDWLHLAQSP